MKYKVVEKFLAACTYTDKEFPTLEDAKKYISDEIERLQCFRQSMTGRPGFKFTLNYPQSESGDFIVQVHAPHYVSLGGIPHETDKMDFLVMYRVILNESDLDSSEQETSQDQAAVRTLKAEVKFEPWVGW